MRTPVCVSGAVSARLADSLETLLKAVRAFGHDGRCEWVTEAEAALAAYRTDSGKTASASCDCERAGRWACAAAHLGLDPDHAQPEDWRARVAESTFGPCDCDCHGTGEGS